MRFKEFYLTESSSRQLIVVDVQPAYKKYISFNVGKFITEIKAKDYNKILYLYNGPDFGMDSEKEIKEWLYEELDYNDDFVEFAYSKIHDIQCSFHTLFQSTLDISLISPTDLEEKLLMQDGFEYSEEF